MRSGPRDVSRDLRRSHVGLTRVASAFPAKLGPRFFAKPMPRNVRRKVRFRRPLVRNGDGTVAHVAVPSDGHAKRFAVTSLVTGNVVLEETGSRHSSQGRGPRKWMSGLRDAEFARERCDGPCPWLRALFLRPSSAAKPGKNRSAPDGGRRKARFGMTRAGTAVPIKLEEVRKMVFTAEVTPPDGGGRYWKTPHPMEMHELVPALQALGCTQDDIRHAIEKLGQQHYRQMAALTEPVLREALQGTRKLPPQTPWAEAWLGYALYSSQTPLSLEEVFDSADFINHAIPSPDVVAWAFLRLRERGWLEVQGDAYGLTEEGRLAMGTVVNEGVVGRLEKWMSANPPPATVSWIRRYVEEKRSKGT